MECFRKQITYSVSKVFLAFWVVCFVSHSFAIAQETDELKPSDKVSRFNETTTSDHLIISEQSLTDVYFHRSVFKNKVDVYGTSYLGSSNFSWSEFQEEVLFARATFQYEPKFVFVDFRKKISFLDSEFKSGASFDYSTFEGEVEFLNSKFLGNADFRSATFDKGVDFHHSKFSGEVSFQGASFKDHLDLREANFDSVETFILAGMDYPEGRLFVYWDQLKAQKNLRIKPYHSTNLKPYNHPSENFAVPLVSESLSENEVIRQLDITYKKLSNNFLAQGNESASDEVLYELGQQKFKLRGGFWLGLYGFFLGYGYKAWRFVVFLVIPIILFFGFIWYFKYYSIIALIVNRSVHEDENKEKIVKAKTKRLKFPKQFDIHILDHSKIEKIAPLIYRIWHVLIFSASVLMGIRFRKEWSEIPPKKITGRRSFLWLVSAEYFLGIGLYISFAILVKGSRFDFIKGLIGF